MRRSVGAIALITVVLACTGCPLMIVGAAGSAAYEGYKYEHGKNQPTKTASSTNNSSAPTTSAQGKIPDSDIE